MASIDQSIYLYLNHLLQLLELSDERDLLGEYGRQGRNEDAIAGALLDEGAPHRALFCLLQVARVPVNLGQRLVNLRVTLVPKKNVELK